MKLWSKFTAPMEHWSVDFFAGWWAEQENMAHNIPFGPDALQFLDKGIAGITLYKRGPFQVQLFLVPPNTSLPEHSHPDVDVIFFYVTGQFFATLLGHPVVTSEHMVADEDGNCAISWKMVPTPAGYAHGAEVGPLGCAFISVQKWLNGAKPSSIEQNWTGDTLGEAHHTALTPKNA